MIKLSWWMEVLLGIALVFLVIHSVLGVPLSLLGAAVIVLIYEGWKVLND